MDTSSTWLAADPPRSKDARGHEIQVCLAKNKTLFKCEAYLCSVMCNKSGNVHSTVNSQ